MSIKRLTDYIFRRKRAYRAVFQPGGITGPSAEIVMADLAQFCRAMTTPAQLSQASGMIDPIATGIAIGRLEVWQRIAQNLHVSDAELYKMVETERQRQQSLSDGTE